MECLVLHVLVQIVVVQYPLTDALIKLHLENLLLIWWWLILWPIIGRHGNLRWNNFGKLFFKFASLIINDKVKPNLFTKSLVFIATFEA
jgi:hypothetical protein